MERWYLLTGNYHIQKNEKVKFSVIRNKVKMKVAQ